MLEYQLDQMKIMDFLLIDKFWARELFFGTPSMYVIVRTCHKLFRDHNWPFYTYTDIEVNHSKNCGLPLFFLTDSHP